MAAKEAENGASGQKILCVEDNVHLCAALEAVLLDADYTVAIAHTAADAVVEAKNDIDLILLDLGLPDRDGFELLTELRSEFSTPVIVLTGNSHQVDKVKGLELGADDYITKPFDRLEMLARIRNVLRRASIESEPVSSPEDSLYFDGWSLCQRRRTLKSPDGSPVTLTVKEFDLLCVFVRHAEETLSRDMLMDAMAGITWDAMDRRIDVLVSRLRKKLARHSEKTKSLIETVRCSGYRFAAKVSAAGAASSDEPAQPDSLQAGTESPDSDRPEHTLWPKSNDPKPVGVR